MDRFLEEIVVKKNKTANEILFVLSMIVMVLSGLYAVMMLNVLVYSFTVPGLIMTLLSAGIAVMLFLFRDRLRTEYEYTFTNGDLDFAMVFNNSKRKSLGNSGLERIIRYLLPPTTLFPLRHERGTVPADAAIACHLAVGLAAARAAYFAAQFAPLRFFAP